MGQDARIIRKMPVEVYIMIQLLNYSNGGFWDEGTDRFFINRATPPAPTQDEYAAYRDSRHESGQDVTYAGRFGVYPDD